MSEFYDDLDFDLSNAIDIDEESPHLMAKDMSLIDYFAGQLSVEFIKKYGHEVENFSYIAWNSYAVAEALMSERSRRLKK